MSTLSNAHTVRVAEAFNGVARSFETMLENDITRGIRRTVYAILETLVEPGSTILDINCGIGIDAVELAKKGYRVAGADLSPNMIQQARLRAAQHGSNIEFIETSFEDLSPFSGRTFDLVLSNFGGLNCVSSLENVAERVARVTAPGGYFLAVVMPPVSLWEVVAGLTRFNVGAAFRRWRTNVQATGFGGNSFTVSYFSPRRFAAAFRPWFATQEIRGVNIMTPPPHATKFAARLPRLTRWLERFERTTNSFPLLRAVGDHYVIVLKKQE